MKKWKVILRIIGLLLVLLLVLNLELLTYGLRQARGQFGMIFSARDVSEVLLDEDVNDSLKIKLKIILDVKEYASEILGLAESEIYQKITLEKDKYKMYVVTAAYPYKLQAHTWKFPVAGEVPYKGFFDLDLAVRERNKLSEKEWDSSIRMAGGWSTLGWLENPLLPDMLERSTGDLVNLVLHEIAHETIYIQDDSELNENLATFIGDQGTRDYLELKFGLTSDEYNEYVESEEDTQKYSSHFLRGADKLKEFYSELDESLPDSIKRNKKDSLISQVLLELDTISFYESLDKNAIFGDRLPNNTYFLSFLRYRSGQEQFYKEWEEEFNRDLPLYLSDLKKRFNL